MKFQGREAFRIDNDRVQVTVLREGGHVAEILDKASGVNPLWIPPWQSIEPSTYSAEQYPEYGGNAESKLLAGIMGHNLCLDVFGPPSDEETAAGLTVHGEGSVVPYGCEVHGESLEMAADLPLAGLRFRRRVSLGETVAFEETVENLTALDRAIAWTQHVSLGPPFLQHAGTRFTLAAEKSRTFEGAFGGSLLAPGTDFKWPMAPLENGGSADLSTFTNEAPSAGFTTHLLDRAQKMAGFSVFDPATQVQFGYEWQRADFPWIGIWEENRSRTGAPWNARTVACGMEFGVSPFPETRREMIDRSTLFGVPCYRWLPAKNKVTVKYFAFIRRLLQSP